MIKIIDNDQVKAAFERALPGFGFTEEDDLMLVNADSISQTRQEEIKWEEEIKNTKAIVIFYSFFDLSSPKLHSPKILQFIYRKNCGFIRMPALLSEIRKLYEELMSGKKIENKAAMLHLEAEKKQYSIGYILHDISPEKSESIKKPALELAEKEFGITGSEEEVRAALNILRKQDDSYYIQRAAEDRFLPGVFCDIEGTLIKGEKLNEEIFNKLVEYEGKGVPVNIWTGGDTERIEKIINSFSVLKGKWLILNKYNYYGFEAEIVIDDMPEKEFSEMYRIKFREYVQVK